MLKLKGCPWEMPNDKPHSIDVFERDSADYGSVLFAVYCGKCMIDGPLDKTKDGAIKRWNRRSDNE